MEKQIYRNKAFDSAGVRTVTKGDSAGVRTMTGALKSTESLNKKGKI